MWATALGSWILEQAERLQEPRLQKPHSLRSYKRVTEISLRLAVHPYYSAVLEGAQIGLTGQLHPGPSPCPFQILLQPQPGAQPGYTGKCSVCFGKSICPHKCMCA